MSKLDEVEQRIKRAREEIWAYEHPIPDETHEEMLERERLLDRAQKAHQLALGERKALEYEQRQERGEVGPELIDPNEDPEEGIKRRMKAIDDWSRQPDEESRRERHADTPDQDDREEDRHHDRDDGRTR